MVEQTKPVPELSESEKRIAHLLLKKLPPEMITAAGIYLKIIESQEDEPEPFLAESGLTTNMSEERARLMIQVKEIIFRSFWFAPDHILSHEELYSIFTLSGIHNLHLVNPVAKQIHEDVRNWSQPMMGYQDQVHRMYVGPVWVVPELYIHFSQSDLHNMVFDMVNRSGDLELVRVGNVTKLHLSSQIQEMIALKQS